MNQINIRFKSLQTHSSLLKIVAKTKPNQTKDDEITMLD
jgi:hypothetical protein